MKHHLLTSVAVVAALAFSAPVWAQQANPSGGNAMGTPGPNPGGPGLTPYNSGPNPGGSALSGPRTAPSAPMAPSAMPPSSMSDTSSEMPPKHHRASRHASHGKPSHHPSRFSNLQGNVANQLNQEELQRLQAGNFSNPSAPSSAPGMMAPGQPGGGRMTTHGTVQ